MARIRFLIPCSSFAVLWLTALTLGQTLGAAGNGEHLWLIRPAPEGRFNILHRHRFDAPGTVRAARTIRGKLAPGGWTAGGDRLWLIYDNLAVHALDAAAPDSASEAPAPDASAGGWRFGLSVEPAPPRGLIVRSLAASDAGLFILVRVENTATLEALDRGDPATEESQDGDDAPESPTEPPQPEVAPEPAPAAPEAATREPRLLHLDRQRWTTVPLPDDWPGDAPAWLVFTSDAQPLPMLLVQSPQAPGQLWVYSRGEDSETWSRQEYPLPGDGTLVPVAVDRQLVIARVAAAADDQSPLSAALTVLRRGRAVPIGTLSLSNPPSRTDWALAPAGDTAALIAAGATGDPVWARLDLQGQTITEPAELALVHPATLRRMADSIVLIVVLVIATLIMLAFWRRDPAWNKLELPKEQVLTDLLPRTLAGLIDLGPCIGLSAFAFGVPITQFAQHWPGRSGGLDAMAPGLVAIGLFVLHTMLSEMFTGKTLGKALMGLRVATMRGQPPHVWQILARNLLKGLDLVALPLLILLLIGPNHQRLGDLVARTVVVMPSEDEEKGEE